MEKTVVYGFIAGLHLGRFTNIVSNFAITGIVLYFMEPNFYTYENFTNMRELVKTNLF